MHPSQLPEKPLAASINSKLPPPTEVYFFERENGEVLHVDERMAWNLYKGRSQVVGRFPERMKIIGVGSGEVFQKAQLEAQQIFKTQGLEAAQQRLRNGVQEELEACRGKVKIPRNFDEIDRNGNAIRINDLR